jgi:hypothetical protein
VEATLEVKQAVGCKDVEMRMEEEIIAESVDGGHSGEAAIGQVETGAEGFEQGVGGGFVQEMEQVAALAEDAAQDFRDGENELAVPDFVTDGGGYPLGAQADAALVAGGAGRWKARRVFIRTFDKRCKNSCEDSLWLMVRAE